MLIVAVAGAGIGAYFLWRKMSGGGTPDYTTAEGRQKAAEASIAANTARDNAAQTGASKTATATSLASVLTEFEKAVRKLKLNDTEARIKAGSKAITNAYNNAEAQAPGTGLAAARGQASGTLTQAAQNARDAIKMVQNSGTAAERQRARCASIPQSQWTGWDAGCAKLMASSTPGTAGLASFAFNRGVDLSSPEAIGRYAGGGILGLRR